MAGTSNWMLSFYVFLQNNIEEDQKLGEMKMFFAQKTPLQDALFKYLQELDQQAGKLFKVYNFLI